MAEDANADAPASDVKDDPIMDILTEDMPDTSEAKSSPAKEAKAEEKPEVAETKETESKAETEGDTEDVADDTAETSTEETEAQPQGKAEDRKQQLNTEIRDLVAQRNALKTEVEKINAEVYQPATVDELVAGGMDETAAKLEALDQRIQVQDYNNRVAEAQLTIESQSQRVLNDFPMFDPGSKEYNKEIAENAAKIVDQSLIRDENTGAIIGSNLPIHDFYQTLAASYNASAQAGQLKGQQAAEEMLARADDTGGAAPKVEKKDPILAILEDVDGY